MKNILIPTDFSGKSIDVIHEVVRKSPNQQLNIHLVHMVRTPTDISDLMFLKKSRLYDEVPVQFFHSINSIRSAYPTQVASIRFEFYYGSRAGILHSIIENLSIDEICIPNNYNYSLPVEGSVNMLPFLASATVPVFKAPVYGRVVLNGREKKFADFAAQQSFATAAQ